MKYPSGMPGWVDLSTTDTESARSFYTKLFGWTAVDLPTPVGVPYTQFMKGGKLVAGMAQQPPDLAAAGVPSMWNTYVLVESADYVVSVAEQSGGKTVMPAMDVMTAGRMAMLADPSGAVIGVWQPRAHEGAELFNEPGSLTWNELQSWDLEAARPFYSKVFGWRWEDGGDGYQVAHLDAKGGEDTSVAGAMTIPPMAPAEAPSCWMVYFAVEDLSATIEAATGAGATVFLPPMEISMGKFAGLIDPTGAMFMAFQSSSG
ncbi:MAG: VOC family protein [Candidatus Nanopelagicales bacterium]|nr:VOC family protein [Candidatus Nanopelagicales bacterium]MDZ4249408.1 VOC family protein [Candidatus Nanopelagicales bacterium]